MKILVIVLIVLYIIIGVIASSKKFVNLNVILDGVEIYIAYILMAILIYNMSKFLFFNNNEVYIIIFVILFIIMILVSIGILSGVVRILDYYINRKKVFANGHKEIGTIIKIKSQFNTEFSTRHYLIVDINGKKVKSLYYIDDIYKVGENIDVMVYKNRYDVIL